MFYYYIIIKYNSEIDSIYLSIILSHPVYIKYILIKNKLNINRANKLISISIIWNDIFI